MTRTSTASVLAVDLGSAARWALRTADGQVVSGTVFFRPGRFEGGGIRFLRFRGWVDELASTSWMPTAIYFEEVRRHAGVDAAHVYGGLMATLTTWCEQRGVPQRGGACGHDQEARDWQGQCRQGRDGRRSQWMRVQPR